MKNKDQRKCFTADAFYGTSTLSERGQIVIPAEARADLGFEPGDKLIMLRHPIHDGLIVSRIESIHEFFSEFQSLVSRITENGNSNIEQEKENQS